MVLRNETDKFLPLARQKIKIAHHRREDVGFADKTGRVMQGMSNEVDKSGCSREDLRVYLQQSACHFKILSGVAYPVGAE